MGDVLVRNLDDVVIEKLKARASDHHRSLQSEVKEILERAARQASMSDAKRTAMGIRRRLAGRRYTDSGDLLAEDRGR